MTRSTTDTCCLTLPLILEKWQADKLAKRFRIAAQDYNSLLRYELKKLKKLEQTAEYKEVMKQIAEYYKKGEKESKELKHAYKKRAKLIKDSGLTEFDFIKDMKFFYKYFNSNIKSGVALQCIAPQVWDAFEKKLFGNGKYIHFKRKDDIQSLKGDSIYNKSGGREIIFHETYISWNGLHLPLKIDHNNQYETEMLKRWVKYVRILRKPGKNGDRWYAQLALRGKPAIKLNKETGKPVHPIGKGKVGLDIGPQTLAYCAKDEVSILVLADKVKNIERQKMLIQRKMDRSRRATNPGNYAPDGTIKRGVKLTKNKSKRYLKLQKELTFIQGKQASIRKQQHIELANHLLTLGDCFYIEKMNWASLSAKSKKTEISEKTGRYKRKKRFGKSIGNRAPSMFVDILRQKCVSLNLPGVIEVSTSLKASQYNHITDSYQAKELKERWNQMPTGEMIQRDMYSAFLLQHLNQDLNDYNKEQLNKDYSNFKNLHDKRIEKIKKDKTIVIVPSMGIRRTLS